jgi:trimeric autotransporter adhesin
LTAFVRALIVIVAFVLISAVCLVCLNAQESAPTSAASPATPSATAANPPEETPAGYEISGTVKNGKTLLPGVSVTASNTLTGKKYATVTTTSGAFLFKGLPRGRYVVRIEFMGFAAVTEEVVLKPEAPSGKVEAELILASRQEVQQADAATEAARRGFQSLAMSSTLSALAGDAANGGSGDFVGNSGDASAMPLNGAGADTATESVSITGAQGRTRDFGGGSEQDLEDRIQEFRDRTQREGGNLQSPGQSGGQGGFGGGGPGGGGPGGGGGGPIMMAMPRGGRFNVNQPHGFLYFQNDNSALDARPYSLTGIATDKATYNQARFGANIGGPLNIPKIFNGGNKWFFFAGWNGSRGDTPYDYYSTVPTAEERAGNFSQVTNRDGSPVQIFNPKTGQQYQFNGVLNQIDPADLSSAAQSLLQFIPLPNIATTAAGQNFHNVTSGESSSDSVSFRLIHNFGAAPSGPIQIGGPGGGGGGGRRGRRQNNLNFGLNWSRSSIDSIGVFPSGNGGTGTQGLNATAGWVYGRGRMTNNLRFIYNHNHVSTTNLYSGLVDVAGEAGIAGIATDPFGFGLPTIGFTSFGGLTDPTPRRELDQTYTISDTVAWNHGKHNWRFGGDYRRILQSFRSAKNSNGSFVFTGFATGDYASDSLAPDTGYDFADFLIGMPQQTSLQTGTNSYDFRANSYDLYAQDDWRLRSNLTLLLGLRYEYNGPYTEAQNRIVNLDVAPQFTSADVVQPGQTGTFSGAFPASLVRPDRNNFAPRLGLAWKPVSLTVVRLGYGINYNLAQYGTVIQNFAFQPPFANTQTNSVTDPATSNLTLANGFPGTVGLVTNNYAIDPNYRLGYVQIWNLDIQRQLPHGFLLNVGYNGAKGTHLDEDRAILTAGAQPFIYESSAASSILHSASIRLRKRMASGLGFSGSYVFSKSIDDASSIGLGGVVVAQDPFDIAADRSVSSFNQKHKFTGNWMYDLPFGENHRLASKGALSHILNGWQWSGSATIGSGFYFTPNVLGGAVDISRGVSGSQRANLVPGQSISLSDPSSLEWFNTAAFCTSTTSAACSNPNLSAFGDAGRFIIEGPGQFSLNMALSKTIQIRETRALELRLQATNIFNNVVFSGFNTTVNSLAFGEVTSVGSMRKITMVARFRF